ncbi:MAG: hypothetical protein GY929_02245 [Actinomycetia bacterium]|nr:hypothetical protein [Actinomycetes bacterium]
MSAFPETPLPFDHDFDIEPQFVPLASLNSVVAQRLAIVVDQLAGTDGPTVIMGFPKGLPRRTRQPITIEVDERGDESLVHLLLGSTFPDHWRAVAVAGSCRWYSSAGEDGRGQGRVSLALDRAGRLATTLVGDGKALKTTEAVGTLLDLMRRGFGLDTPAPGGSPSEYLKAVWLDRVIERAGWDRSVDWLLLEDLQPDFGPRATWSDVHELVAAGEVSVPGCTPELAQWLDAGSFSRCAADLLLPGRDLVSAAVDLLPPVLVGLVCDSLRAEW